MSLDHQPWTKQTSDSLQDFPETTFSGAESRVSSSLAHRGWVLINGMLLLCLILLTKTNDDFVMTSGDVSKSVNDLTLLG